MRRFGCYNAVTIETCRGTKDCKHETRNAFSRWRRPAFLPQLLDRKSAVLDSMSGAGDRFARSCSAREPRPLEPAARAGRTTSNIVRAWPSAPAPPRLPRPLRLGGGDRRATRYQGTISRAARECVLSDGNAIRAKVGVQGRAVVGPAGAPPTDRGADPLCGGGGRRAAQDGVLAPLPASVQHDRGQRGVLLRRRR